MQNNFSEDESMKKELTFGKELAIKAGEIMLQFFDADQKEQTKDDGTPVTIADTTINSLVVSEIKQQFPEDIIVGEEESTGDYGMGRRWVCDPIDGTAAFVIGLPISTFSLCLVVDGQPTVAVVYEPHTKQLFSAVRGQGSYCNEKKLEVSKDTMDTAVLSLSQDLFKPKYINEKFMQRILALDKKLAIFIGAAFRCCLLAKGRISGFLHPALKPYDIAAGHLIVEEAGGKVTGKDGQPISYLQEFRGAVVSNGIIHDELVALFRE